MRLCIYCLWRSVEVGIFAVLLSGFLLDLDLSISSPTALEGSCTLLAYSAHISIGCEDDPCLMIHVSMLHLHSIVTLAGGHGSNSAAEAKVGLKASSLRSSNQGARDAP